MKEKFNEKVIPVILKFINTKGIQSIKNGMVTSMSPLIIGSIFLILSNFPVKAVVDVLESTGIKAVLDQACGATFSISAMIAVIGISYSYAKLENQEPLNCAIISLASFLILMPSSITTESGEVVTGIINKTWTAGQGMIGAIIVGTGLPQVCNERELLKQYFDAKKMSGFDFAYLYPGMNKVLQAAGRVIRTAEDVGIIVLLDDRFQQYSYRRLFPREWEQVQPVTVDTVAKKVERFWDAWLWQKG